MPSQTKEKQREYSQRWYKKNRKLQAERVSAQKEKRRLYIRQLKEMGNCVDCGEDDWRTLDFDHVRGRKEFGIATVHARSASFERLKAEIAKCDLRCANCHRKRTVPCP